MGRDWTQAWEKVRREGSCRTCKARDGVEPHHLVARSHVPGTLADHPNNIVPLCRACHDRAHRAQLDLLPHLTAVEQSMAVVLCGSLIEALQRVTHQHWVPRAAAAR